MIHLCAKFQITVICASILLSFSSVSAQETPVNKEDVLLSLNAASKMAKAMQADMGGNSAEALALRKEAIKDYDTIITGRPNESSFYNARAAIKELVENNSGKDDYEKAIAISTGSLSTNPNDSKSYGNRADAYAGLKKYDNARNDYNAAITSAPENQKKRWASKLKMMENDIKLMEVIK